ncbi:MAG: C39 family peptidase [Lachnospiraceae bacterium]|nr:C39 family peptidase [Lachnospiraceae bacterium]
MNNYYKNKKNYSPPRRTNSSFGEKIGSAFDVVMATLFSTTFLGFCGFVVLFSMYVTPKDISYFRVYAKNEAQNLVENTSTLASNVSTLATEVVSDITFKYEEYKEKEKQQLAQAELAKAEPVSLTQNLPAQEVEVQLNSSTSKITYFSQTDPRWGNSFYGNNNTMAIYGCGPTTVAMLASSLTDTIVYPPDVAKWAFDNGQFANNEGSYHSIIATGSANYGLTAQSLITPSKETLIDQLNKGNLIVVLMDKGHFTSGGHFIILRGVTENGEVLIADAKSLEHSQKAWSFDTILSEAKYASSYGGPFWSISKN